MGTQLTKVSLIWRITAALALLATMLVITPVAQAAQAATTVSIANGDVASLTAAINAANGGSPQVINLATGGDYVLTTAIYDQWNVNASGLPEIMGDVTIHGNGATLERSSADGTPAFGVLDVGSAGSLKIDNITITGGNNANPWYQNGGGIYNHGTLTVTNSTITGNTAPGGGGGIYNTYGSVTVIGSTIANNTSSSTEANSPGGGIDNAAGTATIVNSTITGNFSNYGGGGLSTTITGMTVINSTITGNSTSAFGGGILGIAGGTVTVTNSIVAGNTSTITSLADVDGTVTDGGNNLIGGDPMLGPLASNGGPTQTMALLTGSPAIDAGNDTICASSPVGGIDQRGYTRPHGSHCDIGAFELDAVPNQPPSLATDQATVSVTEGQDATDTGTVSDPENNTVSLSASIGSVSNNGNGTWSWGFVTTDGPGQSQTVTISGDDGHDGTSQTSFDLVVSNVAPTATFTTPISAVHSGDTFTLSLTNPIDPSTTDMVVGFTYAFDCGSGYGSFSSSNSASCTAGGTSSQSVKAQIKDKDGGSTEYTGSVSIVTDTVAPVTTASAVTADAAPYTFGTWANQAVTVTLSASDSGGSGVAATYYTINGGSQQTYSAPFTLSTDGIATVVYWSTDKAGNEETPHQTVSVNIDTTGPTISGAATTSPNANGWYDAPVTIHWTCSDTLSSIATCPSDTTLSTGGASQTVSGTATDLAGNSTTVQSSPAVNIDLSGPSISGTATTDANSNGWYDAPVIIHWTCSDTTSPVATCPSDTTISTEGANQTVSGTATDEAGNSTTVDSSAVNIDLTAPTKVVGAPDRAPDSNSWYNHAVTFTFSGADATSGIDNCTSTTYSGPDSGTATVTGTCTDLAGNVSAPVSVTVKYDATAPTNVVGTTDREPNAAGWFNAPVTVTFSGQDETSGIDTCTTPTYSGPDSASASVAGSCTDAAGNTSAPVTVALQYDATAPESVTGTADRVADSNGWYNHAVGITFNGQDGVSGISSCTSTSYSGPDSATASVAGSCTDKAGNTSAPATFTLQYDATAPTNIAATFDRDPDSNGWYNHAVQITFSGEDATSGIASCTDVSYSGPDSASASVSGSCTDQAGNQSASTSVALQYDATAPTNVVATTDRAPNGAGWYNAPVTFTFSGDDATSGIATCDPVTYSGPDSAATTVSGACMDVAGNSTTVTTTIAYDATAPVVTYTGSAGNYTIGQTVSINCAASDNLSGVVTTDCQDINAAAYTFAAGSNTISSTATDAAGNVGHGSVTFTVTATADDLMTLTNQFVNNRTVAQRLSAPLAGINLANHLQNPRMKQAFLNTYILLVNQQRGNTLTDQQADTLIALAKTL
jgi:hypothetical protein